MPETLQIRIHGETSLPALVYLPGLHGDWTLVGGLRRRVGGKIRFVEITYPRTLDWSLADYATGVEAALAENQISSGWLLGESYGSQVLWALAGRKIFSVHGLILAGGFVKHPMRWIARPTEQICGRVPNSVLVWLMFSFAKLARFRYRQAPEMLAGIDEFVARRTELDRRAAEHRLHLVAENDPRSIAQTVQSPVFCLSGFFDPIVPWPPVRRWLKRHCPALRAFKVIGQSDHSVLVTASRQSAEHILTWMNV